MRYDWVGEFAEVIQSLYNLGLTRHDFGILTSTALALQLQHAGIEIHSSGIYSPRPNSKYEEQLGDIDVLARTSRGWNILKDHFGNPQAVQTQGVRGQVIRHTFAYYNLLEHEEELRSTGYADARLHGEVGVQVEFTNEFPFVNGSNDPNTLHFTDYQGVPVLSGPEIVAAAEHMGRPNDLRRMVLYRQFLTAADSRPSPSYRDAPYLDIESAVLTPHYSVKDLH